MGLYFNLKKTIKKFFLSERVRTKNDRNTIKMINRIIKI